MKTPLSPSPFRVEIKKCWAGLIYTEEPPADTDSLYRADAHDDGFFGGVVWLTRYPVRKRTKCGAWIGERFVNLKAFKRYACNTEAEALVSLQKRRERQIEILSNRLKNASLELAVVEAALAINVEK